MQVARLMDTADRIQFVREQVERSQRPLGEISEAARVNLVDQEVLPTHGLPRLHMCRRIDRCGIQHEGPGSCWIAGTIVERYREYAGVLHGARSGIQNLKVVI